MVDIKFPYELWGLSYPGGTTLTDFFLTQPKTAAAPSNFEKNIALAFLKIA
jgi:hypothetical protein